MLMKHAVHLVMLDTRHDGNALNPIQKSKSNNRNVVNLPNLFRGG